MQKLADRLRNVRVCCGDWSRLTSPSVTFKHGITGIFVDPPYSAEAGRHEAIYADENPTVAHDVRKWCLENGGNPELRIALCGYEGEHDILEQHGWDVHEWKAGGGYGHQRTDGLTYTNKFRERVWFSPHHLKPSRQTSFA
jgi:hypothetical protein